jgi:hypothetical protein
MTTESKQDLEQRVDNLEKSVNTLAVALNQLLSEMRPILGCFSSYRQICDAMRAGAEAAAANKPLETAED